MRRLIVMLAITVIASANFAQRADAVLVALTNATATATFSQAGFSVKESADGSLLVTDGWAIDPNEVGQTAAYETTADTAAAPSTLLTFTLHQLFGGQHTIGRFRLSATTDNRATFADGLDSGGDVSATWTVLDPVTALSAGGATFTELGDLSLLVGGVSPEIDVYTVTALTSLSGITGFRLEVIEDASLPFSGPGRQPTNGNFVLTELVVDATPVQVQIPEVPAGVLWLAMGTVGSGVAVIRRRLAA